MDRIAIGKTLEEVNRAYKELQERMLTNTKEVDDGGAAAGAPPSIGPAA